MKMNVYSIHDVKVSAFTQPFFSPTHGAALRAFQDHVNEPGTPANKHPDDFVIHHIGTFNDETGLLEPVKPQRLGVASEYLNRESRSLDITEAIARKKGA